MARTCFPQYDGKPAWFERCPRDRQADTEMWMALALRSCPWSCFLANTTEPRDTAHGGVSFGDWDFLRWEVMGMEVLRLKGLRERLSSGSFLPVREIDPPGSLMGRSSSVLWALFLEIWQCHRIPVDAAVSMALCRQLVGKKKKKRFFLFTMEWV